MPAFTPYLVVSLLLSSGLLLFSVSAAATEPKDSGHDAHKEKVETRQYINLRGGASSANLNQRPEVCMEGSPFAMLSVESCGTGNGIWHHDSGTEMMHVRLKLKVFSLSSGPMLFQYGVGAGMAELQVAADDPGIQFGTGPRGVETAGAEGSMFLRGLLPLTKAFELVGDLQTGTAYLPSAPELIVPKSAWQPFVTLSVGVGY
ncbi:MAG: hypothetical protein SFV15_01250 [Polyangiaceae bacterium]|nr:hypothetical protein [Polyangiaceae bacterium]